MNIPIIIETDVLKREGVTYIRQNGEQRLMIASNITYNVNSLLGEQFSLKTSLVGDKYNELILIVKQFLPFLLRVLQPLRLQAERCR